MKNLTDAYRFEQTKTHSSAHMIQRSVIKRLGLLILGFTAIVYTGCTKQGGKDEKVAPSNEVITESTDLKSIYTSNELSPQTLSELQQVKAATAKYSNLENAFKDNYVDIGLKMENMGYHFLKAELVSPTFNLGKPALLVYNKRKNGSFELVAVEYAVPIDPQSPNTPPAGFTGSEDEWDFNTLDTGWWTLHAWVWKFNPDGVFKPMNPLLIVN